VASESACGLPVSASESSGSRRRRVQVRPESVPEAPGSDSESGTVPGQWLAGLGELAAAAARSLA
jgi:hypothetical protein